MGTSPLSGTAHVLGMALAGLLALPLPQSCEAASVNCASASAAASAAPADPGMKIADEAAARRRAEEVAQTCFQGMGVSRSPLAYAGATAHYEAPSQAAGAGGYWRVWIPEQRTGVEPSGLLLFIDPSSGRWTRPMVD